MAETLTNYLTDEELIEFYEKLKSKNQLENFLKALKIICDDNINDEDNIDELLETMTNDIIEDDTIDLDKNELELEKNEELEENKEE
jgi:hypothetical protein